MRRVVFCLKENPLAGIEAQETETTDLETERQRERESRVKAL